MQTANSLPQLDYLLIAAHPDDAEIGAAGALLELKSRGLRVGVLDLTSGEPTPQGTPEIRARETAAATALLGLDWRGNLGLPNRALMNDLDARHQVAALIRQLRPRVLLSHYWDDAHPDHVAASALVDAARFWAKLTKTALPGEPHYPQRIVYFFSVHLRLHIKPSFVIDISAYLDKKMQALACYHSQFIAGRAQTSEVASTSGISDVLDDIRDRARYWGWTIGTRYGEPFLCREEVGLRGLQDLA